MIRQQVKSISTNRNKITRRQALTLVETAAAVVALCAVLAVIVPALGETRRRGKDTVCSQNLHRIIQANSIYSGRDSSEAALPAGIIEDPNHFAFDNDLYSDLPAYAFGGKSGIGTYLGSLNISISQYGPGWGLSSIDRPLNSIISKEPIVKVSHIRPGGGGAKWVPDSHVEIDAFTCPSDSGYSGLHVNDGWRLSQATSYTHFGTSYAANVLWATSTQQLDRIASVSPYLRPLSRIPNPARTIAYMENNGRSAWRAVPETCPIGTGLDGTCGGWHGKDWTFNTAFLDGNVKTIYMRGYRSEPVAHSPLPGLNISCVVVRGEGWQIDTFPSAPINTLHPHPNPGSRVP